MLSAYKIQFSFRKLHKIIMFAVQFVACVRTIRNSLRVFYVFGIINDLMSYLCVQLNDGLKVKVKTH